MSAGRTLAAPALNTSGAGLFGVDLNVTLGGASWAQLGVLVLWDPMANAVVGHVALQKLRPGAMQVLAPQPTHFDNCLQLSPRLRLRWTVDAAADSIELGLE